MLLDIYNYYEYRDSKGLDWSPTLEPPNHVDPRDLEDVLATDELFLNYFNEFLALPTFPEALKFNKDTGWFEIVDGAKQRLSHKIKAAVRANKKKSRIYRAVNQHSFTNLPVIPLEDNFDLGPEEIDTSFTVTTLNKEQGLRWIKDNRFPAFLQSDLYIEYRLAKILSQTNDAEVERKGENAAIQLDYTPHPVKIRPEDIVEEEEEDDSELLLKNMCVCMGEAHPTITEAFLSRARLMEGTSTTTSSTPDNRPISSLVRPDSGLGSLTRLSSDPSSSDEDVMTKLFVPTRHRKSITPRPNDVVCHTTDAFSEKPGWQRPVSEGVYVIPAGEGEQVRQATYLEELERLASESSATKSAVPEEHPQPVIVFKSADELATVISGTVLKYLLAEFNSSQPETYAHHKAVRDLISQESMRDYTLTDIDNASCEWQIDNPREDPKDEEPAVESVESKSKTPPDSAKSKKSSAADSDQDSVLGSDDDYDERDEYFRRHKKKKFYPLNCKQGIDDFKDFLHDTPGERHWMLWIDIDRARTLGDTLIDMPTYLEDIRDRYHKKGSVFELTLGTKQALHLTDSSQWTMEKLISLQNKIAEPLLIYWAPRYIVKNQANSALNMENEDYKKQKHMRATSACKHKDTHPEPKIAQLLPLRPKSCKPNIRTTRAQLEQCYDRPSPKDFVWQPPPTVALPSTKTPIGRRRTHAIESVNLCNTHAAGHKQRLDHEEKINKQPTTPRPSSRMKVRPHSASGASLTNTQLPKSSIKRPSTAIGTSRTERSTRVSTKSSTSHRSIVSARRASSDSAALLDASDNKALTETVNSNSMQTINSSVSESGSDNSEFTGGRRMNSLLKALNHEHESGLFFQTYIQVSRNTVWLYCLKFWEDVQEYHKQFYAKSLNKYLVLKKAREIFSMYIAKTATKFIGCKLVMIQKIQMELSPPYEELFDDAEVYALELLLQAWQSMSHKDEQLLQEVQTKNIVVNLETKSKLVINLQRRGFLRPGDLEPDEDPMENFEDPVYDESLLEGIPEEFREFTLEKIVRTPIHLENFRQFLQSHFATMDLSCWMDIEQLRKLDPKLPDEADTKAREIKQKYFNKKYFFGPNSPATREGLDNMMKSIGGWGRIFPDRPDDALIIGAQEFVKDRLSLKWMPMFLASEQFVEMIRPSRQMVDAAEAVLLAKQRRNQRLMKMLEGRWVSSSKEIITFRRSLLNPVVSYQFQRFVSVKSDLLENDVLFWRECQKYKHLHHQHTDDSFIVQKINVIINCFIDTNMPTPLQIDIPQEQAERITEKKRELGPYIFREAQLTVFRVLFEHWADFCTFKSNTATEQILPTIERKRRRAKLRERQRQKELEEQQERENARRRALGLPVEGDDNEDNDEPTSGKQHKEEEEKSEKGDGEGQRVIWSYSSYMDALDKEDILNKTNEDTFSCLSGDSGHDGKPRSAKPTVDVSDLKDMKAPQTEKLPEPEPEIKPVSGKKRQHEKSKPNNGKSSNKDSKHNGSAAPANRAAPNVKADKNVTLQVDKTKTSSSSNAKRKPVPPVAKKNPI